MKPGYLSPPLGTIDRGKMETAHGASIRAPLDSDAQTFITARGDPTFALPAHNRIADAVLGLTPWSASAGNLALGASGPFGDSTTARRRWTGPKRQT